MNMPFCFGKYDIRNEFCNVNCMVADRCHETTDNEKLLDEIVSENPEIVIDDLSMTSREGKNRIENPGMRIDESKAKPITAAEILHEMAETYKQRNAIYGDNYKMVAKLMAVLFPNGVPPELVITDQFHLFELMLVKLSRFAISNLSHVDSVHDTSVYGAMIEAILRQGENNE